MKNDQGNSHRDSEEMALYQSYGNWDEVDPLVFDKSIILGIKAIKEAIECSLPEATKLFHNRYLELRERFPDKFEHSAEDYWADFHN